MATQTSIIARTAEEIRTYQNAVQVAAARGYIRNPGRLLDRLTEQQIAVARDQGDWLDNHPELTFDPSTAQCQRGYGDHHE